MTDMPVRLRATISVQNLIRFCLNPHLFSCDSVEHRATLRALGCELHRIMSSGFFPPVNETITAKVPDKELQPCEYIRFGSSSTFLYVQPEQNPHLQQDMQASKKVRCGCLNLVSHTGHSDEKKAIECHCQCCMGLNENTHAQSMNVINEQQESYVLKLDNADDVAMTKRHHELQSSTNKFKAKEANMVALLALDHHRYVAELGRAEVHHAHMLKMAEAAYVSSLVVAKAKRNAKYQMIEMDQAMQFVRKVRLVKEDRQWQDVCTILTK
jgi:hypothetical protein